MALYKDHSITIDTKRTPRIALQNIVAGETGNRITVKLTNDGSTVSLASDTHRVCLRVYSDLGPRRQDSAVEDSGITFSNGKAVILLSKDSFTAGMNRCRLEVFTTESADYDILICSAEWVFRAAGNPTGENAGNVYPSLIELENELEQCIEDAEEATDAANTAAETLNGMLENIDNEPTQGSDNLVKSGGVYNALAGKQNTLTFDNAPTAGSNNPVKSGGIKTAIDAAATKNVYLVKHSTESWIENAQGVYKYQSETDDTGDELRAISADSVFASQVVLPNGKTVTANEKYRYDDIIFFESDAVDGAYVTADMNMSTPSGAQLAFTLHTDESPLVLHASTITFDEANPIKLADEYDILSVDFVESGQTLFDAIGVRPIEVILPYNGTKFRLREIATAIEDGQRTEKTVELAAAGDLLRTVPGAFSNAYMSLAVAPHAPGYLLNVSGYVVITESSE